MLKKPEIPHLPEPSYLHTFTYTPLPKMIRPQKNHNFQSFRYAMISYKENGHSTSWKGGIEKEANRQMLAKLTK